MTARYFTPGPVTYLGHLTVICALALAWLPVAGLRMVIAPLAELLIAWSDELFDMLAERFYR